MSITTFRAAIALVILCACATVNVCHALDKTLKFNSDGKFKIVHVRMQSFLFDHLAVVTQKLGAQFTDMHFGETDVEDFETQNVQRAVLAAENPDLVVLGMNFQKKKISDAEYMGAAFR